MGRNKKYAKEDLDNAKLRGDKLKRLRMTWGFKTREKLASDEHWQDIFRKEEPSLNSTDGIGKRERGEIPIEPRILQNIADSFHIDRELMDDKYNDIEKFQEMIELIFTQHKNVSIDFSLKRIEKTSDYDIIYLLKEYSKKWRNDLYSYKFIKDNNEKLITYTERGCEILDDIECETSKAFLLLISIYKKKDWKKWTIINKTNEIAVVAMLEIFKSLHARTRLRSLFAMQYFDYKIIDKHLSDYNNKIDEINIFNIRTYVKDKSVYTFMVDLSKSDDIFIANKSVEILHELSTIWGIGKERKL